MAENDDVSGTPGGEATPPDNDRPAAPTEPAAQAGPPPAQPVLKARWRDRAWDFRAMLAVALATFLIGGLAGGAVVAVSDNDHDHQGRYRVGPGDRIPPGWRDHRRFEDGPRWRWNDGPQPPDGNLTPYGSPSAPTPSPSQ